MKALTGPLEVVVKQRRPSLERAVAATKALELSLKVDVASALGCPRGNVHAPSPSATPAQALSGTGAPRRRLPPAETI